VRQGRIAIRPPSCILVRIQEQRFMASGKISEQYSSIIAMPVVQLWSGGSIMGVVQIRQTPGFSP